MADEDESSKTEDPTSRRLSEARRKGNVARSSEIDHALFLLMFLLVIGIGGKYIIHIISDSFRYAYTNLDMDVTPLNIRYLYLKYMVNFWIVIGPIGFAIILGGFLSMILQVGWMVVWENLKLKWDIFKFNGLSKIFSPEGLKKLIIDLIKLSILFFIAWLTIRKFIFDIMGLVNLEAVSIYMFLIKMVVRIIVSLLIFYAFFGIVDFIWTKFQFTKKLKMTKSEVKDEFRQMEGDPQVKRKILTLMMEESMKRMMKEVPTADVVITNPTHIAIAIKYDKAISDAPLVVAKGKRLVAEKIKELARLHDIPIIEDKPLARLLFKHSSVGKPIDVQFYAAVAEILAKVFKMKNRAFE